MAPPSSHQKCPEFFDAAPRRRAVVSPRNRVKMPTNPLLVDRKATTIASLTVDPVVASFFFYSSQVSDSTARCGCENPLLSGPVLKSERRKGFPSGGEGGKLVVYPRKRELFP